ncbi:hypothetical protein AGMMS50218_17670 [Actinomycetota bacterium]|nr:hypothetical protein AGMMS50218_17670 [Actinomycetota bacterium]
MPVGHARLASTSISAIGRAVLRVGACATVRGAPPPGPTSSATEPQAWHSPHRPTHLAVVHPHSAQRYPGRAERSWRRSPAAAGDAVRGPAEDAVEDVVVVTSRTVAAPTHTADTSTGAPVDAPVHGPGQ